jgi:hypothetical protein
MRLSREEELFLRYWMYDEEGQGLAKRLQVPHRALPADLAALIAAAIPDPGDQEAASLISQPVGSLAWPWSDEGFRARVAEARAVLADRALELRTQT